MRVQGRASAPYEQLLAQGGKSAPKELEIYIPPGPGSARFVIERR